MREKPKIIFNLAILASLTFATSAHAITDSVGNELPSDAAEKILIAAMKKYCIPPDGYNCSPTGLAKYNGINCQPDNEGYFWDESIRVARLMNCPNGYLLKKVSNGSCAFSYGFIDTQLQYVGQQCPSDRNLYKLY